MANNSSQPLHLMLSLGRCWTWAFASYLSSAGLTPFPLPHATFPLPHRYTHTHGATQPAHTALQRRHAALCTPTFPTSVLPCHYVLPGRLPRSTPPTWPCPGSRWDRRHLRHQLPLLGHTTPYLRLRAPTHLPHTCRAPCPRQAPPLPTGPAAAFPAPYTAHWWFLLRPHRAPVAALPPSPTLLPPHTPTPRPTTHCAR